MILKSIGEFGPNLTLVMPRALSSVEAKFFKLGVQETPKVIILRNYYFAIYL